MKRKEINKTLKVRKKERKFLDRRNKKKMNLYKTKEKKSKY